MPIPIIAAVVASVLFLLGLWLFFRSRTMRHELDDQGIKLTQLTNIMHEQKKELASVRGTVTTLLDEIEQGRRASKNRREQRERPKPADNDSVINARAAESSLDEQPPTRIRSSPGVTNSNALAEIPTGELDVVKSPSQISATKNALEPEPEVDAMQTISEDKASRQARAVRPDPRSKEHRLMREYDGLEDFMASVAGQMSKVGFFLPSDEVLPVGTRVDLDLRLKDRTPLITGKGEVRRAHSPSRDGDTIPGMDIRFIYIDPSSKEMIRRILAER